MTPAEMFFCGQSGFSTVVFSLWPSKYPGSTQTGVGVDANQHALKMTLLQLVIISLISALYSNQFHCTRHKDPQKSGRSAASRHEGSIWSNSLSKYMYKSMIELKIKKTRTHISWRQFYSVFYFYFLSLSAEAAEQQRTDHWDGVRRVKLSHSVNSLRPPELYLFACFWHAEQHSYQMFGKNNLPFCPQLSLFWSLQHSKQFFAL